MSSEATAAAAGQARTIGERVRGARAYRVLVAVGLVSYGVVHLLIGWIAVQVAWGGGGQDASNQGALRTLATTPVGPPLLVVVAVGLLTLVVWQAFEAGFGNGRVAAQHDEKRRTLKRIASGARAVVYLLLAISAIKVVAGSGSSSSDKAEETLSSRLLAVPFGRVLVVLVAAIVVAIAVAQVVRGVRQKFSEDLRGTPPRAAMVSGTVGYVAKGVALAVVGALFAYAALSYDPQKAGGMDSALRTIREQPFGAVLLTALAVGFVAFGIYCFAWARHAET